jgi:hypothetical protein
VHDQAYRFGMFLMKAVLDGRATQLIDLAMKRRVPTDQKPRAPAAGGSVEAIMTKGARGFDPALFPN